MTMTGKRRKWPIIAARIDPLEYDRLLQKHPNRGEVTLVLRVLVQKYLSGKILGVRLENTSAGNSGS